MKNNVVIGLLLLGVVSIIGLFSLNNQKINKKEEVKKEVIEEVAYIEPIVYDGLTLPQLAEKLDRSLNSTLKGTGSIFAKKAIELGVDPYLAIAIVLHETGCTWNCSSLVKTCNNVGGMKGKPGCFGGSYARFATLEEGINSYMDNLYKNYISLGLNTPLKMQKRYTGGSTSWAGKVSNYIKMIKSR